MQWVLPQGNGTAGLVCGDRESPHHQQALFERRSHLAPTDVKDERIGQALTKIHERPDLDWTVAKLAEAVDLSRSAFASLFADAVGRPPMEYLRDFRLGEARRMLRDPERGLKEIAARIGYRTASAFSVAFKRETGMTPRTFRTTSLEN